MDYEFTTDGCSGGLSAAWRRITGNDPPWEDCCVGHDRIYYRGGSSEERRDADKALAACVALNGHPVWAAAMYVAVRIGGHPLLPLPWRWGYGWRYPRNYERTTQ